MEPFKNFTSTAIPLPVTDVDTDQIIPARFLKATTREGFGENLFRDWRYYPDDAPKDFVLNDDTYSGKILVAGKNFGCGSSREHAAWAIHDFGLKVVVSSFFADIFKNNSLNNGLLPITVTPEFLEKIFAAIEKNPKAELDVNLDDQNLTILDSGESFDFEITSYKKKCLKNGYDNTDYILSIKDKIVAYEEKRAAQLGV